MNETLHVFGRQIAGTSLTISRSNFNSVNDKTNMKVLALSLWENFSWGLIYFDEFIYPVEMLKCQQFMTF